MAPSTTRSAAQTFTPMWTAETGRSPGTEVTEAAIGEQAGTTTGIGAATEIAQPVRSGGLTGRRMAIALALLGLMVLGFVPAMRGGAESTS
jgi:hypothetical protein